MLNYSSASEFVTLTVPFYTVPFRYLPLPRFGLAKSRVVVAKNRTVFRFLKKIALHTVTKKHRFPFARAFPRQIAYRAQFVGENAKTVPILHSFVLFKNIYYFFSPNFTFILVLIFVEFCIFLVQFV